MFMLCRDDGQIAARMGMRVQSAQAPQNEGYATYADYVRGEFAKNLPAPEHGVQVIPVNGVLASEATPFWEYYGDISYEMIMRALEAAAQSSDVRVAFLRVMSPGGMAIGIEELATYITELQAAGTLSVMVHADEACSAAYYFASQCSSISVSKSSLVGSIGTRMEVMDMSKMLDDMGIKITAIYEGEGKTDGAYYQPLSEESRERLQTLISDLNASFIDAVAQGRGMSEDVVRALGANLFVGEKALSAGLADQIMTPRAALAAAAARAASSQDPSDGGSVTPPGQAAPQSRKETRMAKQNGAASKAAQTTSKPSNETETPDENEEDVEASADAEVDETEDEEDDEDSPAQPESKESAKAEQSAKDRIFAILELPEAKGREAQAQQLAKTDVSVEQAKAVLSASPKAADTSGASALAGMNGGGSPNVESDSDGSGDGSESGDIKALVKSTLKATGQSRMLRGA